MDARAHLRDPAGPLLLVPDPRQPSRRLYQLTRPGGGGALQGQARLLSRAVRDDLPEPPRAAVNRPRSPLLVALLLVRAVVVAFLTDDLEVLVQADLDDPPVVETDLDAIGRSPNGALRSDGSMR
jgi:hypothetical protein